MKRHHALWMLALPMAILALGCEKTPADELRNTLYEMAEVQEDGFEDLLDVISTYDDACGLAVKKGREVVDATNAKTKILFDQYRNQVRKMETKDRVAAFDDVKKRFAKAVQNMQKEASSAGEDLQNFMKACSGPAVRQIGGMMAEMQSALSQRMFKEW